MQEELRKTKQEICGLCLKMEFVDTMENHLPNTQQKMVWAELSFGAY